MRGTLVDPVGRPATGRATHRVAPTDVLLSDKKATLKEWLLQSTRRAKARRRSKARTHKDVAAY